MLCYDGWDVSGMDDPHYEAATLLSELLQLAFIKSVKYLNHYITCICINNVRDVKGLISLFKRSMPKVKSIWSGSRGWDPLVKSDAI